MTTSELSFNESTSGGITHTFGGYSVDGTGYNYVHAKKNDLSGSESRGFMQFDTSSIGAGATVTQVRLYVVEALAQSITPPDAVYVYIGSWIGASLDASAADYDGGNDLHLDIFPYGSGVYIDLSDGGDDPTQYVNVTGTTDIALRPYNASPKNSARDYNQAKSKCKLEITYTSPEVKFISRLALMGVGSILAPVIMWVSRSLGRIFGVSVVRKNVLDPIMVMRVGECVNSRGDGLRLSLFKEGGESL